MGVSLLHGKRLFKKCPDGAKHGELFAKDGDWNFPLASSVSRMVSFCESRGIREDVWPIFYGIDGGDVDLNEVADRCSRLRKVLAQLNDAECESLPWLIDVRQWLEHDELFVVLE